jgi:anti-sigma factor RsiW
MSCTEELRTQSLLDGELHGAAAQEAERHLESCPDCQALAADIADVSDALRGATRHVAPAALRTRIADALKAETVRRPARNFWAGVASGGGGMALAAGLAFFVLLPPSAATLTGSVVDAHGRALLAGRTIMVASSNHHTVKPWLAAHVALSPPVTDFTADGFVLVGGRTDDVAGTRAAVTVYRHGNHEVDLFAWPDRGAHLPAPAMTRGFRTMFWKSGDLDFAAVSDIDAAAFEKFSALARAQRE